LGSDAAPAIKAGNEALGDSEQMYADRAWALSQMAAAGASAVPHLKVVSGFQPALYDVLSAVA